MSWRAWYRFALRAYPRAVREAHGDEMERCVAGLLAAAGGRGVRARAVLVRAIIDALVGGLRFRLRPSLVRGLSAGGAAAVPGAGRRRNPMGSLGWDVRYALRMMVRQPLFTVAAVLTLALGIGATTAVFSIVYAILGRPFPYPESDRLVMVWSGDPSRGWMRTSVSLPDAWDWYTRTRVFESLGVIGQSALNLTGLDRPEQLNGAYITPSLFDVFLARPALGRAFAAEDNRPGAPGTAILTWGFWQRRFGGDAGVLGRTIQLDGEPYTVIGVMPQRFLFPEDQPDVLVPLREDPATARRANHWLRAIARLAPGVTIEQANREVEAVSQSLAREYPETNRTWIAYVVSLREDLAGDTAVQASYVLMGAVAFVLLMACVNVANLLLARANARRREIAVRSALGAGRSRVMRQLLTESLLVALAGGALGVLLAVFGVRAIVAALPSNVPGIYTFAVDEAVLLFALFASVGSTLLFGLVPALRASASASAALREEGRSGEGMRSRRVGGTLVVVQTALAVVLLVGGGIMMRSVIAMQRQDLGYDPSGVLTLRITPPASKYADHAALETYYERVLENVRAVPGVESAGTIQSLPVRGSNSIGTFNVEGDPRPAEDGYPARMSFLSAGYTDAMRIPILRGRGILATDRADGERVALVNDALVRQRSPDTDPIGRRLVLGRESWTIVGVVADMRERSLQRAAEPSIYLPAAHGTRSRSLAIRTTGDPAALADAVQAAIWAVDPDQPIYELQPMEALIAMRVSPFKVIASILLTFAAISLLLGGVGIYGVTAYGVGRRTNEIGIRLAIGARREAVVRLIIREALRRVFLGLAIGLVLAFALVRGMEGLLVGVGARDPLTFASVTALLTLVALLGAWLPARRAARLDPVRALAHE